MKADNKGGNFLSHGLIAGLLCLGVLLAGVPALSEATTPNTLKGTVTTVYGQTPASAVAVKMVEVGTGVIYTRVTDGTGAYEFNLVPDGDYYVAYTHPSGADRYLPGVADTASATVYSLADFDDVTVDFDLYPTLPELEIWPGNNSVGSETTVGNPTAISLALDNANYPFSELDVSTLSVTFDGVDITSFFLQLPPENFAINGNKLIINLSDISLPPGDHTLTTSAGNTGHPVTTLSRTWSIQSSKGFQIGFHTPPIEDWQAPFNDWAVELNRANETFGRQNTLIGFFSSWKNTSGDYEPFNSFICEQIRDIGAVPVMTWQPFQAGAGVVQPDFSLDTISQGGHDAYLTEFAGDVLAFGKPVILRIMHEFNGDYYPWAGPINGNDPTKFIAAFQHIVSVFKSAGATNAQFMWSPNYASAATVPSPSNNIEAHYPGDAFVDWIGVSGYNWGSNPLMQAQGWLSFTDIFDSAVFGSFLSSMASAHPSKKIIIAEIGCNDDTSYSKADWILDTYAKMAGYANISGAVWFNDSAVHNVAGVTANFKVLDNTGDAGKPDTAVTNAYKAAVQ